VKVQRFRDLNVEVAGQLQDMALIHPSPYGRLAYRRAAQAILRLEESIDAFLTHHALQEIPFVGPASAQILSEYLQHRESSTVERRLDASGRRDEVMAARALRVRFLSRAGALVVLQKRVRGAMGRSDYQGDLQMHTEWSDGAESIAEMAERARKLGYRYIAITDHSYGLRIARGMSMGDAARQRREIDRLQRQSKDGFRIIQGIEANIPANGGVDMQPAELAQFELVLAAPHSKLRRTEDQTQRMLAAVRHPGVHILAHPRGRMYSRAGVQADWDRVFAEANRCGVAIELDGDPYRQDLDFGIAGRALDAGCLFALDSDAHASSQLVYAEFALAHARLAGIPAERVLNAWPPDKLLAWARRKTRRRR
jgi:histidinol phosphatase-like PHP family hydrolase